MEAKLDSPMIEHEHKIPKDLTQAMGQQKQVFINTYLRTIEFMLLQMEGIFNDFPQVQSVSFELDEDTGTDSMPMFYVLGDDVNKNLGDIPEIEAIAQQWNDNMHPGVIHFLEYAHGFVLTRENLVDDRTKLIKHLSNSLPLSAEEQQNWFRSFDSFLKKRDLEAIAGHHKQGPGKRKIKPGM